MAGVCPRDEGAAGMKGAQTTRRGFLKHVAAAGAAAVGFPTFIRPSALGLAGTVAPSGRSTMGSIGAGGRGMQDTNALLGRSDVRVLAACDVYEAYRQRAKQAINGRYGNSDCATYRDFRDLLARRDIDAVLVATPDHWHAIPTIEACRAGKDVFCEKPLTLTIHEGRKMVEAARRYGRVVCDGSQRVLGDCGRIAQYVLSGALGEVKEIWIGCGGPSVPCDLPGHPIPVGLDWDFWLGPAPYLPFNRKFLPHDWRPYREFSGGAMTNWGGHWFGGALYTLDMEQTGPTQIIPPTGGEPLTYVFANGIRMYVRPGRGIQRVRGALGETPSKDQPPRGSNTGFRTYKGRGGVEGDFLHCVRTRQLPFRDVEIAHRTATVCHLGNIACWLGRPLRWDPDRETFGGDDEANRWLDRPRRAPWRL